MGKNKLLDIIIGDTDKWKKLPMAFKETKEDLKTSKRWGLILIFIICFGAVYGTMQGARWLENNMQYCEVIVISNTGSQINPIMSGNNILGEETIEKFIERGEMEALPVPEGNHSYHWYLKYYKEGRKQPWVGLNCSWDIKRFCKERGIC